MAPKGSKKQLSQKHEQYVADTYFGRRSPSSGAHYTDAGDVRTASELIECKVSGGPGRPCDKHKELDCKECMRTPTMVKVMEKVADEAWEISREPVVALRFWLPHSKLAHDGWVDLTVRLLHDDADRTYTLRSLRGEACAEDGVRWQSN